MGALTEAKKKKKKHPAAPATPPDSGVPENAEQQDSDEQSGAAGEQPEASGDENEDQGDNNSGAAAGAGEEPDQGGADADEAQSNAQDNEGGGQSQGQSASPVPNPQAPGAGDTTTGGDDTPPTGSGDTGGGETPGEDTAAGPGSTTDLPQVPMPKAMQEEYQRLDEALSQILYGMPGDTAAQKVIGGLLPQGPSKIKSVVSMSLILVKEIYLKVKPPIQLVLPFTKDVVAHVMDIGQQVKSIQYSDQESTAILGATLEGVLRIFGVSKQQVQNLGQHVPKSVIQAHAQKYQDAHAFAKPAIDANNKAWHDDSLASRQPSGQGGPQTGAPVNATPQPQSGPGAGPPQAPQPSPPPGTLAQGAAAESPEGGQ